jgi:hypothetical protein
LGLPGNSSTTPSKDVPISGEEMDTLFAYSIAVIASFGNNVVSNPNASSFD